MGIAGAVVQVSRMKSSPVQGVKVISDGDAWARAMPSETMLSLVVSSRVRVIWDMGTLPKWIPTQIDVGHVIVAIWYYNKAELHLEFEGNIEPGSLIYKYLLIQGVL